MRILFRKSFLLILTFFALLSAQAQDSLYHSTVSMSFGSSHPYGNFAATNISKNTSDYALTGFNLLIDFTYRFPNSKWGVNFNFLDYENPINKHQMENYYNQFAGAGESFEVKNIDSVWSISGGSLGITFQQAIDKNENLIILVKLAMGGAMGSSPSYDIEKKYADGSSRMFHMYGSGSEIFFVNVGLFSSVELQYMISKRFCAKAYVCHLLKDESLVNPFLENGHNFKFSTINPGLGIGYKVIAVRKYKKKV